jgi:hypothetical protein
MSTHRLYDHIVVEGVLCSIQDSPTRSVFMSDNHEPPQSRPCSCAVFVYKDLPLRAEARPLVPCTIERASENDRTRLE